MTVYRPNHLSTSPGPVWYRAYTLPAQSLAVRHAVRRLVQLRRRAYLPCSKWWA